MTPPNEVKEWFEFISREGVALSVLVVMLFWLRGVSSKLMERHVSYLATSEKAMKHTAISSRRASKAIEEMKQIVQMGTNNDTALHAANGQKLDAIHTDMRDVKQRVVKISDTLETHVHGDK